MRKNRRIPTSLEVAITTRETLCVCVLSYLSIMNDTFSKGDIMEALTKNQFEVHYQPIIDKKKECVVSAEALARWNHPDYGLLLPHKFIPAAEQDGAIHALGEFVLREACAQSKKWKDEGHEFYRVSVNLSLAQLSDMKFPGRVKEILAQVGLDPRDLDLEITESMAMIDPDSTKQIIGDLKEAGIRIMLDDFGAGYSSLSHVRNFPIDGLKIDGQFIRHSLQSERDSKLMHSIILLANALDLHVVAEGVETKDQMDLLINMECNHLQGFYFTHPLPADEYVEWCALYTKHPALRV